MQLNFFNSLEYMEPRCSKCRAVLEFGVNTHFDDKRGEQVCNNCSAAVKNIYAVSSSFNVSDFDMQ